MRIHIKGEKSFAKSLRKGKVWKRVGKGRMKEVERWRGWRV